MSVTLETSSIPTVNEASLQMMPCTISSTGDAAVDQFFTSSVRTIEDSHVKSASFRGRPLTGCEMEVPEGYTGLIMKENRKPFSEDEERSFRVTHKFKKFTFWNLDKEPSVNDKYYQAMDWIDIASTIHSAENVAEVNGQNSVDGEK